IITGVKPVVGGDFYSKALLQFLDALVVSFVINPVKEVDEDVQVRGVGHAQGAQGVQNQAVEGVEEDDEVPEDTSQLTLAQLRTSFKTLILQYIQPVQWGLSIKKEMRLVPSTPYININLLCRDDLTNLFEDVIKLSNNEYLLFGRDGYLEHEIGQQLNNTGVVQQAVRSAIARYKTWTKVGLKLRKPFHQQFSHSNRRYFSVDGHIIFPKLSGSEVRGLQSAIFDQNKQTAPHIEAYFLDSCDAPTGDTPWPPTFPSINLCHLNLMRMALEKGSDKNKRLVVHPLGYKIKASAKNVIELQLIRNSTINFPTSKNRFLTYRPGAISITYDRETGVFKTMLPLRSHHMTEADLKQITADFSHCGSPRRYPTTTTPGVNRHPSDINFNAVQELLADSFKAMADTRKLYAANPGNPEAREEYRHASHLVGYLRHRIQNECSAKHRRKLEDAMTVYARQHNFGSFRYDSNKLGGVHAEDT
ncbi:hypothetical protein HDU99_006780, partial [Rhizoclosmatium hyalinum]